MPDPQSHTESPEPPPEGVASPPPAGFVVILWIGAFSVMVWGLSVLFARRSASSEPPSKASEPDLTLDE